MQILIVDGHSMIFQWPELRALHARKGASAREALVRLLTRYQDGSGVTVAVVFDGRGVRPTKSVEETAIHVFYSMDGQTADSLIERLVAKYGPTHSVVVATDDNLERQTVEAFGGMWMSSDQLQSEIIRIDAEVSERIDQLRRNRR